ncbi:hypothetical protein SAMN05444000_11014 [Shimia gijangensis]|uniref:DUF465 domain-containing protein n=1 Tax=Shimia gijangensis TaxID=1470563 RepID=A0A1M6K6E4_9RHOB|nr:hypothetical protein [Shimia gijangensis]SHJ54566.1 hypothetical protein SAMN05444000_11014 [Shimia gijangensis]
MHIMEESFPEHAVSLRHGRGVDSVLDEICRDYETLSIDLQEAERSEGRLDRGYQVKLRDSLKGLREEILARLRML